MGLPSHYLTNTPVIELDVIDSTNNYAMRLIDADTAQPDMTITALRQTAGKGQRGRQWNAEAGESLLMSIIIKPELKLEWQFLFAAAIAVAVADAIDELLDDQEVKIKWTNDIIIGDKKAGGILIENVLRGNNWNYAVVGIGINILQTSFPGDLQHATSFKKATRRSYDLILVRDSIRMAVLKQMAEGMDENEIMNRYNGRLYKKNELQLFANDAREWKARIVKVLPDGRLNVIEEDGRENYYTHGFQNWVY